MTHPEWLQDLISRGQEALARREEERAEATREHRRREPHLLDSIWECLGLPAPLRPLASLARAAGEANAFLLDVDVPGVGRFTTGLKTEMTTAGRWSEARWVRLRGWRDTAHPLAEAHDGIEEALAAAIRRTQA